MRKWRIMDGIKRCVITHEGHTVMCATPTDARIVMESVNSLIEAMESGAAAERLSRGSVSWVQ